MHVTDLKSKELKSQLEWAARKLRIADRLPRVEPAVFLTDPGLRSELDEVQKVRVYGRDDAAEGPPWIWRDLLARPPKRESQRITPHFAKKVLPALLTQIGVRSSTAHLRFGDDRKLAPRPLDSGPTWGGPLRGASRHRPRNRAGPHLPHRAAGHPGAATGRRAGSAPLSAWTWSASWPRPCATPTAGRSTTARSQPGPST